jgi:hypothetical protein
MSISTSVPLQFLRILLRSASLDINVISCANVATGGGSHSTTKLFFGHAVNNERVRIWFIGAAIAAFGSTIVELARYPSRSPGCVDFWWMWLGSKFALAGRLAHAYDYPTLAAAALAAHGCIVQHLDYPPTVFLFLGWASLTPYKLAYAVWVIATLCFFLAAMWAILPRFETIFATLGLASILFNVALGHDGFLTAGLFGFALITMKSRPWLSGFLVGMIAYKPQFGILFPIAFLASGNWRMMLTATAGAVTVAATAGIIFGFDAWEAWVPALMDRASAITRVEFMPTVLGCLRFNGVSPEIAWTVQLGLTMMIAITVVLIWSSRASYELKAASLATGAFAASPHTFPYDATIVAIGAAFLVRDLLQRGYRPGELWTVVACWGVGNCIGMVVGLLLAGMNFTSLFPTASAITLLTLIACRARKLSRQSNLIVAPAQGSIGIENS